MRKCWRNSGALPITKSNPNSDTYTKPDTNASTASPARQFC